MEVSKDSLDNTEDQSTSTASSQSSTSFIISSIEDITTSIESLLALEKDFPTLKVSTINNKGDYILKPTNPDSLQILEHTRVLSNGKTINLCSYSPPLKKTKMVLEGYPLGFPEMQKYGKVRSLFRTLFRRLMHYQTERRPPNHCQVSQLLGFPSCLEPYIPGEAQMSRPPIKRSFLNRSTDT